MKNIAEKISTWLALKKQNSQFHPKLIRSCNGPFNFLEKNLTLNNESFLEHMSDALKNKQEWLDGNRVDKVYNLIILDESGSMHSVRNEILDALKEIYENINQISSKKSHITSYFSFVSFENGNIKFHEWNKPVKENLTMDYNYNPEGSTNLLDATCTSILKLKNELKSKSNYRVFVTIITDGEENSSTEYSLEETRSLINDLKATGKWEFLYIGADHNVNLASRAMNITNSFEFEKNNEGIRGMCYKLSDSLDEFYKKF